MEEPPYLVRTADGQVVQLPPVLYAVVEAADGTRDARAIAAHLAEAAHVEIAPDDIGFLIREKLAPLGLIAGSEQRTGDAAAASDPMLALRFKVAVIPPGLVRAGTTSLKPLFWPPVVIAALGALVAFDVWLFGTHGIAQSVRALVMQPALIVALLGAVVVAAAWHEWGHATGAAYGGAEPGAMGAGLYVVWPVFYTDVTDSYRLGRGGRLRTDLGGVYFNGLFILAVAGAYALTRWEFLLIVAFVQHLAIVQQLLPLLRLDGYLIISDLTGVPDMFARIGPILRSLLPWRHTDDKVKELKPWVRVVVTAWVLLVVPLMLYLLVAIILHVPRVAATAGESLQRLWGQASTAADAGDTGAMAAAGAQMALLILPPVAMGLTFTRASTRITRATWQRTRGRPLARAAAGLAAALMLAGIAFVWWPNEDYRPIQPGERWTVQELTASFADVPTGRSGTAGIAGLDVEPDQHPVPEPTIDQSTDPVTGDATSSPSPSGSPSPSPSGSASPSPSTSPSATASPSPSPSL